MGLLLKDVYLNPYLNPFRLFQSFSEFFQDFYNEKKQNTSTIKILKLFMKKMLFTTLLFTVTTQAELFIVGEGGACAYQDLQMAIDDSLNNSDVNNEIRMVNDGSFNHHSFTVDFSSIQGLSLFGGFATCEDAIDNIVTDKTIIDAQDIAITNPIFSVSQQLSSANTFISLENFELKNSQAQRGAGVLVDGVRTFISNSVIANNQAENGAGIYCKSDLPISLSLNGVDISQNHASNDGGGIYLAGQKLIPKNTGCQLSLQSQQQQSNIASNQADNNGGAIFIDTNIASEIIFADSALNHDLYSVVFANNSAINGGAVYQASGLNIIKDTKFINNHASNKGGAIYAKNILNSLFQPQMTISGEFINNDAVVSGGALFADDTRFDVTASVIQNNSAPTAAFADFLGAELNMVDSTPGLRFPTVIADHHNSQSLIRIRNTATRAGKIILTNVIIKNNNTIDNLIDVNTGVYFLRRNYIFGNHVNNALFNKNNSLGAQFDDKFYFNTIADNTVGTAIFSFVDNDYKILNNIIWQPAETPFDINNGSGIINCNILNSQLTDFAATNSTNINPQFVNPSNDNYHVKITSRAIDYCQYNNDPPFGFNDQDFYDIDFIDNLFGFVDIGADKINGFEFIFANSFE